MKLLFLRTDNIKLIIYNIYFYKLYKNKNILFSDYL